MADNENNNEIIIPEGGHLINNYGPFPGPFGPGPGPEHHDGCNCPNLTIPQTTGLPKPDLVPDDFEKCLSYEEQICRLRQDFRNATAPDVDATGTIINNGGEPEVDVDAARTGAHSWLFNFIFKNAIGQQGPAGYSPEVTVTDIPGGHRITITDEDHPSGQSVDVMDGVDGQDGQPGAAATVSVGTTTTGEAGSSASVTNSGTSSAAVLNFIIPKGDKGDTGASGSDGVSPTVSVTDITGGHRITITDKDHPSGQSVDVMDGVDGQNGQDGAAATVAVGTTTTGAAGTNASVTNSGTSSAAVLNFTIPRGAAGQNGVDGSDGVSPAVTVSSITGGHEVTITDKDHPTGQSFNVMDGQNGSAGAAATVAVGTTTTGAAGSSASVTNSGTSSAAVLNFIIPRGDTGATGSQGPKGDPGKFYLATCSTAAGTAAKVITVSSDQNFVLEAGAVISIKPSASNTAENVTFNVNNTGAKSIYYNNAVYTGTSNAYTLYKNRYSTFVYDGTYWVFVCNGIYTSYSGMSVSEIDAGTSTSNRLISAENLKYAIEKWAPEGLSSDIIAEEYSTAAPSSYAVDDICTHNGNYYRCTGATSGAWDASKWTQFTLTAVQSWGGNVPAGGYAKATNNHIWYNGTGSSSYFSPGSSPTQPGWADLGEASEYVAGGGYAVGDYCIYQDDLYRCIAATSGSWDSTKWTQVQVMSEVKAADAAAATAQSTATAAQSAAASKTDPTVIAEAFSDMTIYVLDDYCTYNGKLYKRTGGDSMYGSWDPAYWTEVTVASQFSSGGGGGGGGGVTPIVFTASQISVGSSSLISDTSPQAISVQDLADAMKAGATVYLTQDMSSTTYQIAAMDYNYNIAVIGFAGWPMVPQILTGRFVESGGVIQEIILDYVNN